MGLVSRLLFFRMSLLFEIFLTSIYLESRNWEHKGSLEYMFTASDSMKYSMHDLQRFSILCSHFIVCYLDIRYVELDQRC
jgi:hypothetical protein